MLSPSGTTSNPEQRNCKSDPCGSKHAAAWLRQLLASFFSGQLTKNEL